MQPDRPLQPDGSVSCPDHPCDGCYLCRRRRCCRQDRPDFPRFGDWTQPIYGELGVLAVDEDDKLICHVCGKPYHSLDHHARLAHDLWPEEYKVLFGLERGRALESPTLRARRRVLADERLRPWRGYIREIIARTTPEQRAAWGRGKTRRLETLQDPDNRAHWRQGVRRARQTRRARIAAGHRERPQGFQAGTSAVREASARGRARRAERLQDPLYRAALGRRISQGKGGRASSTCLVCGAHFEVPSSWLRLGYGKLCSTACREQWKLQRGRGRDGLPWQQVAERLRALGPAALDALAPPAPEIVRRFYGLVDDTPWTQRAIAEHLGLTKSQVRRVLGGAQVTRLLGEPPRRQDRRTVSMACAICGAAVERQPGASRDRVQTTCGPECQRELRRRMLAAHPPLDRATHIRAGEAFRQKLASPEFRQQWEANQRAAKRRRGRPHADALRARPAEAFVVLDERERDLVRRYFGLDGSAPETQRALARASTSTARGSVTCSSRAYPGCWRWSRLDSSEATRHAAAEAAHAEAGATMEDAQFQNMTAHEALDEARRRIAETQIAIDTPTEAPRRVFSALGALQLGVSSLLGAVRLGAPATRQPGDARGARDSTAGHLHGRYPGERLAQS